MRFAWLGLTTLALGLASCALSPLGSGGPPASTTPAAEPSSAGQAGCATAPPGVIDLLAAGLAVRGSYVSNAYAARAGDLASPPTGFGDPWWVAGRINGVGVRPERGAWLWDAGTGQVLSANASAGRYFTFDDLDPTLAAGSAVVGNLLDCVGPIPAP